MRLRVAVSFLLCLSICQVPLSSQQAALSAASVAPAQDPQAMAALTQSLQTMAAIASPTRATLAQGTITYPDGSQKPVSMKTLGTNYIRNDVGIGDFSFVSAAGDGFLLLNGKRNALRPYVTQYKRCEHLPALTLMFELQNTLLQAKYVGIESVSGQPAFHIRLSMAAADEAPADVQDLISEFHVWIDQASSLVVKTRSFDFSPEALQNRSPVDTYYSDYRQQDGAQVPFHMIRYVDSQMDSEIVFSSISLNAAVSTADFR